jgi:hypothetical protein
MVGTGGIPEQAQLDELLRALCQRNRSVPPPPTTDPVQNRIRHATTERITDIAQLMHGMNQTQAHHKTYRMPVDVVTYIRDRYRPNVNYGRRNGFLVHLALDAQVYGIIMSLSDTPVTIPADAYATAAR